MAPLLKKWLTIVHTSISNEADELTPAAAITFVDTYASKPPTLKPNFCAPSIIPARSDSVPLTFSTLSRFAISTTISLA